MAAYTMESNLPGAALTGLALEQRLELAADVVTRPRGALVNWSADGWPRPTATSRRAQGSFQDLHPGGCAVKDVSFVTENMPLGRGGVARTEIEHALGPLRR